MSEIYAAEKVSDQRKPTGNRLFELVTRNSNPRALSLARRSIPGVMMTNYQLK
jgi:hypothetical protein